MASNIDPSIPPSGAALTADVRQNFQYAKDEIEALQADVAPMRDTDIPNLYAATGQAATDIADLQPRMGNAENRITQQELLLRVPRCTTLSSRRHSVNSANCTASAALTLTANRVYFVPFSVAFDFTLSGIYINVTTAVAGNGDCAIYSNDNSSGDDLPGAIYQPSSGNVSMGSTGDKFFSNNASLTANLIYWLGFKSSSAAAVRGLPIAAIANALGRIPGGNNACSHLYQAYATAGLPDPAGTLTNGTGSIPMLDLN